MTRKHTATPWVMEKPRVNEPTEIQDKNGNMLCFVPAWGDFEDKVQYETLANAAFIVRACNLHEGLTDAVDGLLILLKHYQPRIRDEDFRSFIDKCKKLHAKAKCES